MHQLADKHILRTKIEAEIIYLIRAGYVEVISISFDDFVERLMRQITTETISHVF